MTPLGNLPTGGALTTNGRFLWSLSTGRGRNDVRIVQVAKIPCKGKKEGEQGAAAEAKESGSKRCNRRAGKKVGMVVQTIPFPGLTGGIAMSRDGRTAYLSGLAYSSHPPEEVDPSVPGRQGDVIHILRYDPKSGIATRAGLSRCPRRAAPLPTRTSHRMRPLGSHGRVTSPLAPTGARCSSPSISRTQRL